jgi:hypothetical protein
VDTKSHQRCRVCARQSALRSAERYRAGLKG